MELENGDYRYPGQGPGGRESHLKVAFDLLGVAEDADQLGAFALWFTSAKVKPVAG